MANIWDGLGLTAEEIAYIKAMGASRSSWGNGATFADTGQVYRQQEAISKLMSQKSGKTSTDQASSSTANSSSFSGLEEGPMRELLTNLINQMNSGGTEGQKAAIAQKNQTVGKIDAQLGDYSKQAAFQDAGALIQASLNKSMETNKPAIQRAVEGSGTSGGSMQALLSQNLARDASLQAGALGADQAKAYGSLAAALLGQRGQLTTGQDPALSPMLQALDLLKISRSNSSSASSSNFSPQQLNVETMADKLALIEAQNQANRISQGANNDAAMERLLTQLAGQSNSGSVGIEPMNISALLANINKTPATGGGTAGMGYLIPAVNPASGTLPSYFGGITNTTKDPESIYAGNSGYY